MGEEPQSLWKSRGIKVIAASFFGIISLGTKERPTTVANGGQWILNVEKGSSLRGFGIGMNMVRPKGLSGPYAR
jgi:hypothetical protein